MDLICTTRVATTFSQPIGSWDVGVVVSMDNMFGDARSFRTDLNALNVAKVTELDYVFGCAIAWLFNPTKYNMPCVLQTCCHL